MCNCGNLLHKVENVQRGQFFIKLQYNFFNLTIQWDSSNFPYVYITESFVCNRQLTTWNHSFNVISEIVLPHCEMGGITWIFLAKMTSISSFSHSLLVVEKYCPLACYMAEKNFEAQFFFCFHSISFGQEKDGTVCT